jgi:uncharacterized protein YndB with AHSA1/START domain
VSSATRGYAQLVSIAARPSAAWRALTDPAWLTRWYAVAAKVDAREGGRYWVQFKDGREREALIDTLEVGKRMRLIYFPSRTLPAFPEGGALVEDIFVDTEPGRTLVRVLGAGLPKAQDFDAEYGKLRLGWAYYLNELKRLLETPVAR